MATTLLNTIQCDTGVLNTGYGQCPVHFKKFEGCILVPLDKRFTANDVKDLVGALRTMAKNDSPMGRAFPWPAFEAVEIADPEVKQEALNSGRIIVLDEAYMNITARFYAGGIPQNNALRTFNDGGWGAIFFGGDLAMGTVIGGQLAGIPMEQIYTYVWKAGDGTSVAPTYKTLFSFKPVYVNEQIGFVKGISGWQDIKGLRNVDVKVISSPAVSVGGVVRVTLTERGYGYDFSAKYKTELAAGSVWAATNAETGAAITVSSVAHVPGIEPTAFDVTLSTVDTDYPIAGKKINLNLGLVSVLEGAGVLGVEGIAAQLTRP